MPSEHDQLAAELAVPYMVDHFGERCADGEFAPVSIKLPTAQQSFPWPRVAIGALTDGTVETSGRLQAREAVTITGPTAELVTGNMPLDEKTQVTVPRYGDVPFNVQPELCEYGGVMTKLGLTRRPVKKLTNFHEREGQ